MDGKRTDTGPLARQRTATEVRRGVEEAAPGLAEGGSLRIDRLRLRLPAGAGREEIARVLAEAVRRGGRDGG